MMRAVTVPSAATSVPRFCSENSPERCRVLGSIRSTLLGGLMLRVSAVNTMMLIVAATRTPTPNAQVNSVPRTQRSCVSRGWSVTALTHNAARQKDKEVNCEITQHHERDRTSRQHGCAKRYGSPCSVLPHRYRTLRAGCGRGEVDRLACVTPQLAWINGGIFMHT